MYEETFFLGGLDLPKSLLGRKPKKWRLGFSKKMDFCCHRERERDKKWKQRQKA
jgi:hypothetical protein